MADKLSQSQIDALLNAVRSGEKDLSETTEKTDETKYRKYDFTSPRKFTKDRMKMLQSIYDNYARIINTRLNTRLRTNCEVTVESVEEQHYFEFSNALTEGDVLTLSDVIIKDQTNDQSMKVFLSAPTMMTMMDRMMGGEGDVDEDLASDYTYTDLELRLYEDIVQDLVAVMGNSWDNYIPIRFEYERIDVNPTLNQTEGLDEIVVIVDMKLKFPNIEGRMSICLPGEMLSTVFGIISTENPSRRSTAERKADEIFESLRDSELEITASLGSTQLFLEDIYHLNEGDVIDIGISKNSCAYLEIGGFRWFTGHMGTCKKNLAIKIDSVYQVE